MSFRKGSMVLIPALAMTAAASGDVTISIEVPGFGNTYAPAPGETFVAETWITSAVPMTAWGFDLDDGGRDYSIAASEPVLFPDNVIENYCDVEYPPIWDNTAGWDPSPPEPIGWLGGEVTAVSMGTMAEHVPPGATSGFAVWFELTAPMDPAAIPAVITGLGAYVSDLDFDPLVVTVTPLTLLPEPSALCLLALGGWLMISRR